MPRSHLIPTSTHREISRKGWPIKCTYNEAKYGTSPSMSEILYIKETVRSNTQHLAIDIKNPAQLEIRDLAIDRCLERFCPGGCERPDERKSFEKSVGIDAKEVAKQKEFDTVQKQVLEQQKTIEKEISMGPSR